MQPILSSRSHASSTPRQFAQQFGIQRVQRLRPVQRDDANATLLSTMMCSNVAHDPPRVIDFAGNVPAAGVGFKWAAA